MNAVTLALVQLGGIALSATMMAVAIRAKRRAAASAKVALNAYESVKTYTPPPRPTIVRIMVSDGTFGQPAVPLGDFTMSLGKSPVLQTFRVHTTADARDDKVLSLEVQAL